MQLKECRTEDCENPCICPIIPFLALTYKHSALSIDPRHLFPETLSNESSTHIPFNEAVLNTPFFRSEGAEQTAWSHNASSNMLKRLGERAGYQCVLTPYCFRRGTANLLSSMSSFASSFISSFPSPNQHYSLPQLQTHIQTFNPNSVHITHEHNSISNERKPKLWQTLSIESRNMKCMYVVNIIRLWPINTVTGLRSVRKALVSAYQC